MKPTTIYYLFPLLSPACASWFASVAPIPYNQAYTFDDERLSANGSSPARDDASHDLLRRQNSCPSNYNSCSNLGSNGAGACCESDQICTTDRAQNVACCTTSSLCTGTITALPTPSYVSNEYNFPFPYIQTTFRDIRDCSSAYSACTSYYDTCTSALDGEAAETFAVTIVAPNGAGVTMAPTSSLGSSSASSICRSLSSVGCRNLQSSSCESITGRHAPS